jgi:hypothetical protein
LVSDITWDRVAGVGCGCDLFGDESFLQRHVLGRLRALGMAPAKT